MGIWTFLTSVLAGTPPGDGNGVKNRRQEAVSVKFQPQEAGLTSGGGVGGGTGVTAISMFLPSQRSALLLPAGQ